MTTTYEARPINEVPAALVADMTTQAWVVVRTSDISQKAWSFHATEKLARAACRRNQMRDVVTR